MYRYITYFKGYLLVPVLSTRYYVVPVTLVLQVWYVRTRYREKVVSVYFDLLFFLPVYKVTLYE